MIKVGIVGGTGYTGVELLRLLANHPQVQLAVITSRGDAGTRVDDMFPSLRGVVDLAFSEPDSNVLAACDVVFFATPHAVAMHSMRELMASKVRVIDLSADFRVKDVALWERWYGCQHVCPELVEEAVYGLAEINREAMRSARLVAAPGCYPTAVQLGFLPLLESGWVQADSLIANAVSGVSGAGKAAKVDTLFAEVNDSFKAYGVAGHRHLPEIEQGLQLAARQSVSLTFVPHLAPMTRGIHATLYARLNSNGIALEDVQQLFEDRYADEPFVDVLPPGSMPQTRTVRGSNHCRIAVARPQGRDQIVVMSVIDNLVKGASGQAVQAMNIMFGLAEDAGLAVVPLLP
ncbi:MAG TPA: N-acetyl-gamma-glutamyl-phosphate reductase [Pseudomonadales bacterium]